MVSKKVWHKIYLLKFYYIELQKKRNLQLLILYTLRTNSLLIQ